MDARPSSSSSMSSTCATAYLSIDIPFPPVCRATSAFGVTSVDCFGGDPELRPVSDRMELTDATARMDRGPQPGDRRPAPGDLELVQTFLNSRWDLTSANEEELASPRALGTWLVEHGLSDRRLALTGSDLRRVLEVREGLREMLYVNNGASEDPEMLARMNRALRTPRVYVQLAAADTPAFTPQPRDLDGAL